jgi:hypothetical protein
MMDAQAPVFAEIYEDYLAQLGRRWNDLAWADLAVNREGDAALVLLFGQAHWVGPAGIIGPGGSKPGHARCVVLAKYLLARPGRIPTERQWTSYRSFQDAGPFAAGFAQYSEGRIARAFAGRRTELAEACVGLGGTTPGLRLSYDVYLEFLALPRMPMLLLFNDQEEGFPAACSLLFDECAPDYLDMECLAILGLILA